MPGIIMCFFCEFVVAVCMGFNGLCIEFARQRVGFKRIPLKTRANDSYQIQARLKPMLIAASPCESL